MAMAEIATGLTSLKAAYELTKAIKDISDATKIQSTIFELQRIILEAQSSAINAREAHAAQIDRIRELEQEIDRLKAWDAEKQNYELKAIGQGAFAYMLKPSMRCTEPAHWLCQNCYEKGKKSVLQYQSHLARSAIYKCPSCSTTVSVVGGQPPTWEG